MQLPTVIECIAWSNKKGEIKPLRFKVQEDDQSCITCKIDNSLLLEENRYSGNRMRIFRCGVEINGVMKVCELRYEVDSCKWYLYTVK